MSSRPPPVLKRALGDGIRYHAVVRDHARALLLRVEVTKWVLPQDVVVCADWAE